MNKKDNNIVIVDEYVDIIGQSVEKKYIAKSNDTVVVDVPPGCWGPMITSSLKSGHEVTAPIYVEDAKPGDALLIEVENIEVISDYSISGISEGIKDNFTLDPTTKAICPNCNTENPVTDVVDIGKDGIVCKECGKKIIPQFIKNGYTMEFDRARRFGYTVSDSEKIAKSALDGNDYLPNNSKQHSALTLNSSDVKGVLARVNPFIGNIGCVPKIEIPSSRNCGDSLKSLKNNPDFSKINKDDLTDAHMDVNSVTVGSKVICPVKVQGAGLYIGDVHAMQGDGELAGHTTDVTAKVTIKIKLIEGLNILGPIIIPNDKNLSPFFKNLTKDEIDYINNSFKTHIKEDEFIMAQYIGSGSTLEEGINNTVERIAHFSGYSKDEVINRCTISGGVGIGRVSGMVYLNMLTHSKLFNI